MKQRFTEVQIIGILKENDTGASRRLRPPADLKEHCASGLAVLAQVLRIDRRLRSPRGPCRLAIGVAYCYTEAGQGRGS